MYNLSSWPVVNVSKIIMYFKTGAFIPAILNLASSKANQLSASCDQKEGNLKLKFEVKLSLLAKMFYRLNAPEKPGCSLVEIGGDLAEFSIILEKGFKLTSRLLLRVLIR